MAQVSDMLIMLASDTDGKCVTARVCVCARSSRPEFLSPTCLAHRGMFVGAINIRRKLDDTGVLTRATGERARESGL